MTTGKSLDTYELADVCTVSRPPSEVLAEAQRVAKALSQVIAQKPKKVIMNGEQYLEFEDWQTVAKFYGVVARVVETRPVSFGGAQGFEAYAQAVHVATGTVISKADAMCLNDEPKWSRRTKYEYAYVKKSGGHSIENPGRGEIVWENGKPKKERIPVGEEQVPLFQLRSMAQTRACAKALRNAFAWVVVLAGFRPTLAEELDIEPTGTSAETAEARSANKQKLAAMQAAQKAASEGAAVATPSTVSESAPTPPSPDAPSPQSEEMDMAESLLADVRIAIREAATPHALNAVFRDLAKSVQEQVYNDYMAAMAAFNKRKHA